MKVIIAGGTGQIGAALIRHYAKLGYETVVLSRRSVQLTGCSTVVWDGQSLGDWATELDGADVVINLAGRTVNCRYSKENLAQMMSSRVESTKVIGQAIEQASKPPALWLQMCTAALAVFI